MKQRLAVDQNVCDHIWLSELEGLGDHEVNFVTIVIGEEMIEFDICTICGRIVRLIRTQTVPSLVLREPPPEKE